MLAPVACLQVEGRVELVSLCSSTETSSEARVSLLRSIVCCAERRGVSLRMIRRFSKQPDPKLALAEYTSFIASALRNCLLGPVSRLPYRNFFKLFCDRLEWSRCVLVVGVVETFSINWPKDIVCNKSP